MWVNPQNFKKNSFTGMDSFNPAIVVGVSILIMGTDSNYSKVSKILEKKFALRLKGIAPGTRIDKFENYDLIINKIIKIREINKPTSYKIRAWFVKPGSNDPVRFGEREFENVLETLSNRGWEDYVPS